MKTLLTFITFCLSLCLVTCSFAFTTQPEYEKSSMKIKKSTCFASHDQVQFLFVAGSYSASETEPVVFELSPALMDYVAYTIAKQKLFYFYNDSKYQFTYNKTKSRLIDKNSLSEAKGFTKHYIRV